MVEKIIPEVPEKKTITISLDPEEQMAFTQLLDIALRNMGTGALQVVVHFQNKLSNALQN